MSYFVNLVSGIPTRGNGKTEIDASWWNIIKDRLLEIVQELFLGPALTSPFTIANGQDSYAEIDGVSLDSDSYTTVCVLYEIARSTDLSSRFEVGELVCHFDGTYWHYTRIIRLGTDSLNIEDGLRVTAGGAIEYMSDTISGDDYLGQIQIKTISGFKTGE